MEPTTEAMSPENALLVKQILARHAHTKEIVASVCERVHITDKVFCTPIFAVVDYDRTGDRVFLNATINRWGTSNPRPLDMNEKLALECELAVARDCIHFDIEPVLIPSKRKRLIT